MKIFTTNYPDYKPSKLRNRNGSQFYGVYLDNKTRTWRSYITVNSRKIYLGNYKDDRVAAVLYSLFDAQYHGQSAKFDPKIGAPNYRGDALFVGDIGPIPDEIVSFVDAKINGIDMKWTPWLEQRFCAQASFPAALTVTTTDQNQLNTNQNELQFLYQQHINNSPDPSTCDETELFPDLVVDSDTNISPNTTHEHEFDAELVAMADQLGIDSTDTSFDSIGVNIGANADNTAAPTMQTFEFIAAINTKFGIIYDAISAIFAVTPIPTELKITRLSPEYSIASLYVHGHHFILGVHEESAIESSAFSVFEKSSNGIFLALFNPSNAYSKILERYLASVEYSIVLQRLEHPEISVEEKNQIAQHFIDLYRTEKSKLMCTKMKYTY